MRKHIAEHQQLAMWFLVGRGRAPNELLEIHALRHMLWVFRSSRLREKTVGRGSAWHCQFVGFERWHANSTACRPGVVVLSGLVLLSARRGTSDRLLRCRPEWGGGWRKFESVRSCSSSGVPVTAYIRVLSTDPPEWQAHFLLLGPMYFAIAYSSVLHTTISSGVRHRGIPEDLGSIYLRHVGHANMLTAWGVVNDSGTAGRLIVPRLQYISHDLPVGVGWRHGDAHTQLDRPEARTRDFRVLRSLSGVGRMWFVANTPMELMVQSRRVS